jgi:hypothetical protein
MPVSSSTSSAFPRTLSRSAPACTRRNDFMTDPFFETAAISLCSGPQGCSPPRPFLPLRLIAAGQPRLLPPSRTCVVASACIGYANHPPRQLVVWGLAPHEIHSLVGCSSVMGIYHQLDNQKTGGCIFPTACEPKRNYSLTPAPHLERGNMPIATFSSFTDGLDRDQMSREHFITNTNLEDGRLWVNQSLLRRPAKGLGQAGNERKAEHMPHVDTSSCHEHSKQTCAPICTY